MNNKYAVLGGGSWGTAIVKMLCENNNIVNWYVRKDEDAQFIRNKGRNPKYLRGVQAVLLFVKVEDHLKDNFGNEAVNKNGLMQRAIKDIKSSVPEMTIMTDVALDPYSTESNI